MIQPYSATVSNFTQRAGGKSLQVDLRKFDGYRAEFGTDPKKSLPEQWAGFSIFLPNAFAKDFSEEGIMQFQAYPDFNLGEDWRSPPLLLGILNDHYILDMRTDSNAVTVQGNFAFERIDLGLVTKNTWTDFIFHIKWAYNNTGILELWKNGKLVYSRLNKPNSYNDKLYPYFKCGIYKWDWEGPSNSVTTERLLYIDEVRIGNEKATYCDVFPGTLTKPYITGSIKREQWDNVGGTSISDIPLTITPSSTSQLTSFEGPLNIADNYGSRIQGYICPPQPGNYTFWLATDDAGELWLSTDSTTANKVRIANVDGWTNYREWGKYSSQKSAAITLQAGKKYYIEALQKEGGGGDNLSVQWQLPDASMETPIAGSHLSPYVDTTALINQTITFAALPSKTTSDTPFTLSATASSGLAVSFSVISGPATISDSTVTLTGEGSVIVEASQAGNSVYNAATGVIQSFTVSSAATCSATGTILREEWDNVGGTSISDIPLTTTPSSTSQLTSFEGSLNIADNYASRVRG
ncbi:heparin lyase I family protein [Mucilaginibacter arboris]|nr:heparin lyase I family protein [Mucilaginibacter arboris]